MEAGVYYHVYNRGINRAPIFFDDNNYDFFLKRLERYLLPHIDVYAYCLMPNHFHLFIRVKDHVGAVKAGNGLNEAEAAFKNFFISYAKSINRRYHRTGALFQYKFKRKKVTDVGYYTWLSFYIHCNPVKAGLCNRIEDWPFSSFSLLCSRESHWLRREEVLDWYGNGAQFVLFHQKNLDQIGLPDLDYKRL